MTVKEELHQLVDELPENQFQEARELLHDLLSDDPLTPEERAEIERGVAAARRGETVTLEQYERERGL